jgi:sec-independent protein translocase protein TatC
LAEGESKSDKMNRSPSSSTEDQGMAFTEHLEELRLRIIYAIVGLVIGCVISFIFVRAYIFPWLVSPWRNVTGATLQVLGPTEKFMAYFKVGFAAGFVVALPFVIYQIWLFVKPGLRGYEQRWVKGILWASFFLFLCGCAFCFYLVLPVALKFLLGFEPGENMATEIETRITLDRYFSFALLLTLAGGLVFQIPLVTMFLSMAGIITPQQMSKFRRYAILAAVVLAAALTPTGDPITLSLLGVPIYLLYEISIFISRAVYKKKEQASKPDTP